MTEHDAPSPVQPPIQSELADDSEFEGPGDQTPYRVLARKYRPRRFEDLIGQEAMVRILRSAFETGRIAHAFILTGVRGVGKTTTARLLARALNYRPADLPEGAQDPGPSIDMPAPGLHCREIAASAHMDVLEMDAASRTGIGDIREVIESVKFRPVLARYKVYIIDEVHMLSTAAFNGLLKTLEEPPPHCKFIFATTEIRKLPVTVLSRCQRFDLRRVRQEDLVAHLSRIAETEGAQLEERALALIARASEGSVRDALSLLDQAITLGEPDRAITGEQVQEMMGLSDRTRIAGLFHLLMEGKIAEALEELRTQYDRGADPQLVIGDLLEFSHWVTRIKVAKADAHDASRAEAEVTQGRTLAEALSLGDLTRAWQILLKGLEEMRNAPDPIGAAEMVLIRLVHAQDLPAPGDLARKVMEDSAAPGSSPTGGRSGAATGMGSGAGGGRPTTHQGPADKGRATATLHTLPSRAAQAAVAEPEPTPSPEPMPVAPATPQRPTVASFEDLSARIAEAGDIRLKFQYETFVAPVRFADGHLEIQLKEGGDPDLPAELGRRLQAWTGRTWMVSLTREGGEKTVREQRDAEKARQLAEAKEHPFVKAALAAFPGATIKAVRPLRREEPGLVSEDENLLAELDADLAASDDDDDLIDF